MKGARKPKPATRLEPRRVELPRPTYQPSKAEFEEPITLPQMSLEEAAHRLMEPVEILHIDKPRRESSTGCSRAPSLMIPNSKGPKAFFIDSLGTGGLAYFAVSTHQSDNGVGSAPTRGRFSTTYGHR